MAHHLLIGPPASGKSTFAQYLCRRVSKGVVISTDHIRELLYGDPRQQGDWPTIEAEVFRQIRRSLRQGATIIYDATNAQPQHRIQFLNKAAAMTSAPWIGWQMLTDLDTCNHWNQTRDRRVPERVITQMYQALNQTPPKISEGFRAIYLVTLTPTLQIQKYAVAHCRDSNDIQDDFKWLNNT